MILHAATSVAAFIQDLKFLIFVPFQWLYDCAVLEIMSELKHAWTVALKSETQHREVHLHPSIEFVSIIASLIRTPRERYSFTSTIDGSVFGVPSEGVDTFAVRGSGSQQLQLQWSQGRFNRDLFWVQISCISWLKQNISSGTFLAVLHLFWNFACVTRTFSIFFFLAFAGNWGTEK